jgi:hypothetical protein
MPAIGLRYGAMSMYFVLCPHFLSQCCTSYCGRGTKVFHSKGACRIILAFDPIGNVIFRYFPVIVLGAQKLSSGYGLSTSLLSEVTKLSLFILRLADLSLLQKQYTPAKRLANNIDTVWIPTETQLKVPPSDKYLCDIPDTYTIPPMVWCGLLHRTLCRALPLSHGPTVVVSAEFLFKNLK